MQVYELVYFLYRNTTSEAGDATSDGNTLIVADIDGVCGGTQEYSLFSDLVSAQTIRDNINSPYMYASFAYTMLLMLIVVAVNTVYVPYFLKEYQIPLIFRNPDSSMYYDIQRAKDLFYVVFLVLSGIPAQLNFYVIGGTCLHTHNEDELSSANVDMYQYSMTALLWIVSLPMIILFIMVGMRDNLKFGCYPVVLVNLIFSFMLFILS